jgi:integrase
MIYVRDQLGHSSIKITVDIYGHLIPGANKGAVNRLDDNYESDTLTQLRATTISKAP